MAEYQAGNLERVDGEGHAEEWFATFDNDKLNELMLKEEYVPAPFMDSLLVLLTMDEQDFDVDDEDDDDSD